MIVRINNKAPGRMRKDLMRSWVNGLKQLDYEERHGQLLMEGIPAPVEPDPYFSCPRCGQNTVPEETSVMPAFVNLSGGPVVFTELMRESSHGLQRREIHQCMRCHLVITESYFRPGPDDYPGDIFLRIHLIQPEE